MNEKVTFDTVVKPKFYILIGDDQRKALRTQGGELDVGTQIRVTVELI